MAKQSHGQVHLVGSMPLASREEVFGTCADILGARAKRLSDGELGLVKGWIFGHHQVFRKSTAFAEYEHIEKFDPRMQNARRPRFRLITSDLNTDSFGPIGYAEDARAAYEIFCRFKADGRIENEARLLVAMPTPYDILNFAVDEKTYSTVAPVYEKLMLRELDLIVDTVPQRELSIQWDVAHEFEFLATSSRMFHALSRDEIVAQLVRIGSHVPGSVELGFHCCYGNFNLKHYVEPRDTADMVDVMNQVIAKLNRPVQFIHMPVPKHRADEEYFAPLKELSANEETELYLGLVHDKDGIEGGLARIKAAKTAVRQFGISTECGLAFRSPENIRQILRISADLADRIDAS